MLKRDLVVCNNTNVSKAMFDYVAGYETEYQHPDGEPVVAGGDVLPLFSNVIDQRWLHQPYTILVDSRQLESGETMSDDFKKLAAHQIDEFKSECRRRFPGRDTENLTDEDLMREVLNTVGKKDKLGEHVRCVARQGANRENHVGSRREQPPLVRPLGVPRNRRHEPAQDQAGDPQVAPGVSRVIY